jgi:hypothetical protein
LEDTAGFLGLTVRELGVAVFFGRAEARGREGRATEGDCGVFFFLGLTKGCCWSDDTFVDSGAGFPAGVSRCVAVTALRGEVFTRYAALDITFKMLLAGTFNFG